MAGTSFFDDEEGVAELECGRMMEEMFPGKVGWPEEEVVVEMAGGGGGGGEGKSGKKGNGFVEEGYLGREMEGGSAGGSVISGKKG